ncbi:hypothetical protein BV20DRAFT_201274 [Pilatotrama ljubarskyi]|nr:hypothetical protein BV20DRAFT_201274 [Pilatotrama ljubarskyi]
MFRFSARSMRLCGNTTDYVWPLSNCIFEQRTKALDARPLSSFTYLSLRDKSSALAGRLRRQRTPMLHRHQCSERRAPYRSAEAQPERRLCVRHATAKSPGREPVSAPLGPPATFTGLSPDRPPPH